LKARKPKKKIKSGSRESLRKHRTGSWEGKRKEGESHEMSSIKGGKTLERALWGAGELSRATTIRQRLSGSESFGR